MALDDNVDVSTSAEGGFDEVGWAAVSLALPLFLAAVDGPADGPALEVRLGGLKGSLRRFCWGSPAMIPRVWCLGFV